MPDRDPIHYSEGDRKLDMGQLYAIAQCFAAQTDKVNAPVVLVLIPVTASLDVASVVDRYFMEPSLLCS